MADIKTHLRELGVAVGVSLLFKEGKCNLDDIDPRLFYNLCSTTLTSFDFVSLKSDLDRKDFTSSELTILDNSFELARAIYKNFKLKVTDKIIWCGANSHSESPVDLIIGEWRFSLKEESFILENMGLYKYLALMTGKRHDRGLNIYEIFAPGAYQTFFSFVWNKFVQEESNFEHVGSNYKGKAVFSKNSVTLKYVKGSTEVISILPAERNLSIAKFTELTQSVTREKIFSKWIKKNLERDGQYQSIKKTMSELAAANLVAYVKDNLDYEFNGLKRFLRVHEDEYYYAKSTAGRVGIYKVPSLNDFSHSFTVDDISYSVPKSQVNINTAIKNKTNNQVLLLRNEVRFSHGQFNGVSEAKMYYDRNSSLETVYEKIC